MENLDGEKNEWSQGLKDTLPIAISLILFGAIFGLLSLQTGLSTFETLLMSICVFAGAAQFTSLSLLSDQASIWAIILATFLLNSRHFLMGLSLSPFYTHFSRGFVNMSAFFLVDEQYAITLNRFRSHKSSKPYILSVSLCIYLSWVIGTYIGTLAGNWIPDPNKIGLGFSFTAMFLALSYYQLTSHLRIFTFASCGILAVALTIFLPFGLHILISGFFAFAIGYYSDQHSKVSERAEHTSSL